MLSIIAVIGKNRELGKDNKLLWHIPGDLPRFKQLTTGHPVIMGRKTFQSIGKPLPDRTNIVISRGEQISGISDVSIPGTNELHIARSIDEALALAKNASGSEEIFVIGGGSVYARAIDLADRLYLTVVDANADADTFFPEYSSFTKVISEESREVGEYRFTYITLSR